jgi:Fe-S-cluster containining protein
MRVPDVLDCLGCGACCFSTLATYVRVTGSDHARLGERADELVWFDGTRAYMRMVGGHCAALRIEPETGRFFCTVYEARPDTCRDLARGSSACSAERAEKHRRPLMALELARAKLPCG